MIKINYRYFPQRIYIEEGVLDFPLTKRVLKKLKYVPQEVVPNPHALHQKLQKSNDVLSEGKKYILIARQKGSFVKPCPCTPHYIGCNYFIINQVFNCPLDCSYCVLQEYLSNPFITVFANVEDLWRELSAFLNRRKHRYLRIGTGELGDSLVLDHITENSKDLISFFRERGNAYLELKTKSVGIENILELEPSENVVISWSLNSFKIAQEEEKGAPSVEERIRSAKRVQDKGFELGFHFDPLIRYSGWEDDYAEIIELLMKTVNPARISWISLGTLRYHPGLKTIIQNRFPKTKIIYDEFIKGKDGKLRYFKPIRLELYLKIVNFIKIWGGDQIPLYFCMENDEVWREVMNWVPRKKEDVEDSLSSCCT